MPVVGHVGAGAQIYPIDDHAPGAGLDEIEAPPGAAPGAVGVRVRGDSMYPVYSEGDLLFYAEQRNPAELIGRECVVRLADGRLFIKIIRRGATPGRYSLHAHNAPPLDDVEIDWAAPVQWIRRHV